MNTLYLLRSASFAPQSIYCLVNNYSEFLCVILSLMGKPKGDLCKSRPALAKFLNARKAGGGNSHISAYGPILIPSFR